MWHFQSPVLLQLPAVNAQLMARSTSRLLPPIKNCPKQNC